MPKDVRLPNGTLILNVPDDMKKHAIAGRAIREGLATNADFGYEEVEQDKATFLEGMGAGFMNVGRNVGNILGMDNEEDIARQSEIDEGLGGMGKFGKFTGEMLATAPLGMGVGAGVGKGAAALGARSMLPKAVAGTLGKGTGRMAVEGATYGGVLADPGDRTAGALGGAAFGGALGMAGKALGKALGKGQVTKITNEAKQLQKLTGTFIPLSQSAEKNMTRMIYNAFLANIPGVGGKVRGQYQHALDDARKFAAEHAMPETAEVLNLVKLTGRETIDETITKMSRYWDIAFDSIKQLPVVGLKGHTPIAPSWLVKALEKQGQGMIKIPKQGQQMTGAQMLELKTALGEVIPTLGAKAKGIATAYTRQLDDLLRANFYGTATKKGVNQVKTSGRGVSAKALDDYFDAAKYWQPWQTLKRAADKADDLSQFSMGQLAKTAKGGKGSVLPGKATLKMPAKSQAFPLSTQRRVGQLGVDALEDFPSKQGLFQTLAATAPVTSSIAGGMGWGATGVMAAFPIVIALGRAGASKGLQRYLSGQTRFQQLTRTRHRRWLSELMKTGMGRKQAESLLQAPGSATRQAAIVGANNAT